MLLKPTKDVSKWFFRFPAQRRSKLLPRGDGPFQVVAQINDNAYKLDLPGEYNVSATFNVSDLSPFDIGEYTICIKCRKVNFGIKNVLIELEVTYNLYTIRKIIKLAFQKILQS